MDNFDRANQYEQLDPDAAIKYTDDYVRRLLLERHHIYAKLYHPGGSVVLTQASLPDFERGGMEYSSEIGNSFHLDLIDLAEDMSVLSKGELETVLNWIDGMNSQQASYYLGIKSGTGSTVRMRRQRALEKLLRKMNERSAEPESGTTGDGTSTSGREEKPLDSISRRDSGRTQTEDDPAPRDSILSD